jgi:hypothetical protein
MLNTLIVSRGTSRQSFDALAQIRSCGAGRVWLCMGRCRISVHEGYIAAAFSTCVQLSVPRAFAVAFGVSSVLRLIRRLAPHHSEHLIRSALGSTGEFSGGFLTFGFLRHPGPHSLIFRPLSQTGTFMPTGLQLLTKRPRFPRASDPKNQISMV